MRSTVYTADKVKPRIIFEINCDLDLLTACIKDGEVTAADILAAVERTMSAANAAIIKGKAKAKAEAEEI